MLLDEIDLSNIDFWAEPMAVRTAAFERLRAERPRAFFAEPEFDDPTGVFPVGPGYWSLTTHADVVEVSRRAQDFCSGQGTNILDMPPPLLDFFGSMINMDDPRHARMRRIVSRAFTPRTLDSMKADVEGIARDIVEDVAGRGECDFVTDVAALVPLRIIVDLMGIPRSEEQFIFDRTNTILGFSDEEYIADQQPMAITLALMMAGQELGLMVQELAESRAKDPRNDLISALVNADVDGEKLTPEELASFFILLVAAGNETTRNAIAHGIHMLSEHPDQRAMLGADFDRLAPGAVEEIVRWASPVMHFRRTVTHDGVRLGDLEFSAGDKVVMWYWSANRDESVFPDPHRFDITRSPNDHVGFGGPGPHYCLGAHLARRELTVVLREVLRKIPGIQPLQPPDYLRSPFINGIKHLPVTFDPA